MRGFTAALAFLTRIPIQPRAPFDAREVGRAAMFFPLVGALVGVVQGLAAWCLHLLGATPMLQASLSTVVMVVLVGGLHQDALSDMADGFGGGRTREDVLRIMRESVIGAYGSMALILALGTRVAALASLAEVGSLGAWVVVAAALSRGGSVVLAWLMPCARLAERSLGSAMTDHVGALEVLGAVLLSACVALPLIGNHIWLAAIVVAVVCVHNGLLCRRRIGGVSGDTLGAATEVADVLVLVLAVLLTRAS